MKNNKQIVIFLLFFFALISRVYRIDVLSEFLGDQGRTGIEIYHAVTTNTIPLLGPSVLSGQFLGPIFYYIVTPSYIVSGFNPLAPAILTALLGAFVPLIIYLIGKEMFNTFTGIALGILYAVSPTIVTQDRTLWEPTIVPFFVALFIFSLYKVQHKKQYFFFPVAGAAVGVLLQLHYPNLLLLPISGVFWLYLFFVQEKKRVSKQFFLWTFYAIAAFFIVLLPFLLYEIPHNFENLRGVLSQFLLPNASTSPRPPFFPTVAEMTWRLFNNIVDPKLPFTINVQILFTAVLLPILFVPILLKKTFWHIFLLGWFFAGIGLISLYRQAIFDHYLNFLLPIPFLLFGFFLNTLQKYVPKTVLGMVILIFVLFSISQTDIFRKGPNDIARTKAITAEMILQANKQPFAFTLTGSRSFSDLHYRYFFTIKHVTPTSITESNYPTLFLVCESDLASCPTRESQAEAKEVNALCYEPHCQWEYPTISLMNFSLVRSKDVSEGRLFTYQRNTR